MRTEFLPSLQETYNAELQKALRRLMAAVAALLVCALLGLAILWGRGQRLRPPDQARLYGPDGASLGLAILVSPDLALANGEVPANSQVSFHGDDRSPVRPVRAEQITDGTKLTLLRLTALAPSDMVPPSIGVLEAGDRITSTSPDEKWEATLVARPDGLFDMQPAPPSSGSGVPVISVRDRSLVGIEARQGGQIVAVSMKRVEEKFPEISSAQ
jgi:hypothetical protein